MKNIRMEYKTDIPKKANQLKVGMVSFILKV